LTDGQRNDLISNKPLIWNGMTMSNAAKAAIAWTEAGLVPDTIIRAGIRRLNRQRLEEVHAGDVERVGDLLESFVDRMNHAEVAPLPRLANEQHYEVPAAFFAEVLGLHGKYSCCYWGNGTDSLDQAEADGLAMSCERAGIEDGMRILDLGCGWGSLSLWIAERYPASRVTSVSNSHSQRVWIEALAQERGLSNIEVITADMNHFDIDKSFDRIVSVEMFEHMRNYVELFRRVRGWLEPGGRFFMHIFCHRNCAYEFVDNGPADWMGRHFFSGGMMPSADLPLRFQRDLTLLHRASWNGSHYQKTANAWLSNMDARKDRILPLMAATYGGPVAEQWFQRWRIFFMACAELFGHADGQEWFVSHYLFGRADENAA
jgi:cyclopropane-fatty-acyl-phospholipid synthase